jgi:hypothetical protein
MAKLAIATVSVILIVCLVSASFYFSGLATAAGQTSQNSSVSRDFLLAERRKYEIELADLNASINAQILVNSILLQALENNTRLFGTTTTTTSPSGTTSTTIAPTTTSTTTIPPTITTTTTIVTRAS